MENFYIINSVLTWVVLFLNLLLTLALIRSVNSSTQVSTLQEPEGLEIGRDAPFFSAPDLNGRARSIKDFNGKDLLLLFVSPNCKVCRDSMPSYKKGYEKAKQKDLSFVMVSDEDKEKTQAFVEELSINIPMLLAPNSENGFLDKYKVTSLPMYYVINSQGQVQTYGFPSLNPVKWENLFHIEKISYEEVLS